MNGRYCYAIIQYVSQSIYINMANIKPSHFVFVYLSLFADRRMLLHMISWCVVIINK